MKAFFVYSISLLLLNLSAIVFALVFNNIRAFHLISTVAYVYFEAALVTYFIRHLVQNSKARKYMIYGLIVLGCVIIADVLLINNVFTEKKSVPHNSNIIASSLLLIGYIIYYFFENIKMVAANPITNKISFWICVGFFLYYTGTFFVFLVINSRNNPEFEEQMRLVYSVVAITKNIILCLALFANEPTENVEELRIPDELNLDEFTPTNPKTLQ